MGLLPHALCLAARRAHPAHSPGVIVLYRPQTRRRQAPKSVSTQQLVLFEFGAYRIRSAKVHRDVMEVMAGFALHTCHGRNTPAGYALSSPTSRRGRCCLQVIQHPGHPGRV